MCTVLEVRGSSSDSVGPDSNLQTHEMWAKHPLDSRHEDEASQRLCLGQVALARLRLAMENAWPPRPRTTTVQLGELGTWPF